MAFKIAEAYVQISQRGMNNVSSAMSRLGKQTFSLGDAFKSAAGSLALLGVGAGVAGLAKMSAQAEQTAVSFEVMLGSADAASQMIQQLTDFSARTPFSLPGLQDAAKTLLNFSVPANEVMDDINMISNIAAGNEEKMSSLSLVFGQIASTGRLMGQDLLQLINAGFNPLQQISDRTGESMAELKKRMEAGGIGFSEVRQAFADATSEGGRFYQMNERQSQTVAGLWSTLSDNVVMSLRSVSDAAFTAFDIRGALQNAIAGVKQFTDLATFAFDNFGTLSAIGVEHMKMFASNAVEQVRTWAVNSAELAQWFGDNWKDVLTDYGNLLKTFYSNWFHNILSAYKTAQNKLAELALRAQAFLSGTSESTLQDQLAELRDMQGAQPEFKGLYEGFKSSIKELPKLTKAELAKTSPELERLYENLKLRPSDSPINALAELQQKQIQDSTKLASENTGDRTESRASSASMGAASFVSSLQGKILDHSAKIQEKQERHLRELKEFMMREGIPIKGGVTAVAAGP